MLSGIIVTLEDMLMTKPCAEVNDKDTDLVGWVSHNLFASVFPESFFSPMYLKRNR